MTLYYFKKLGVVTNSLADAIRLLDEKDTDCQVIDEKLDGRGAALFMIATVAFFGAVVQGQSTGYNNPVMIGAFIVSFVSFVAFIIAEKKIEMPLLDLSIFSNGGKQS